MRDLPRLRKDITDVCDLKVKKKHFSFIITKEKYNFDLLPTFLIIKIHISSINISDQVQNSFQNVIKSIREDEAINFRTV